MDPSAPREPAAAREQPARAPRARQVEGTESPRRPEPPTSTRGGLLVLVDVESLARTLRKLDRDLADAPRLLEAAAGPVAGTRAAHVVYGSGNRHARLQRILENAGYRRVDVPGQREQVRLRIALDALDAARSTDPPSVLLLVADDVELAEVLRRLRGQDPNVVVVGRRHPALVDHSDRLVDADELESLLPRAARETRPRSPVAWSDEGDEDYEAEERGGEEPGDDGLGYDEAELAFSERDEADEEEDEEDEEEVEADDEELEDDEVDDVDDAEDTDELDSSRRSRSFSRYAFDRGAPEPRRPQEPELAPADDAELGEILDFEDAAEVGPTPPATRDEAPARRRSRGGRRRRRGGSITRGGEMGVAGTRTVPEPAAAAAPGAPADAFALLDQALRRVLQGPPRVVWGTVLLETMQEIEPGFDEAAHGFESFDELLETAQGRGILKLERSPATDSYLITAVAI